MWNFFQLAVICTLIWIYLETAFFLLINLLNFTIPWLIWGAIVLFLLVKFRIRIPPPKKTDVEKVLGIDPFSFLTTEDGVIVTKENIDNDQFCMRVVAHRGAAYDYPENSMTAFRNSREKRVDAVEFDVMLTKDKVPIVFHDSTIDRLTGLSGNVEDLTWNELKEYDISTNHPLKEKFDKEEKIALFEEVIQDCLQNGLRMFIDIKGTGNEMVKVILNAYKKYPDLYEKAAISSFNPIIIYMIRNKDPRIVGGMAWRPQIHSYIKYDRLRGPNKLRYNNIFYIIYTLMLDIIHDWAVERLTYYILGISFVILHRDFVSFDVVRVWIQKGVRVLSWPVNLPSEKIYFSKNLRVTYLTDTLLS